MDKSTQKVSLNIERRTANTAQSYAWMKLWDLLLRDTISDVTVESEDAAEGQESGNIKP